MTDWDYSRHYARFHPDTPQHDAYLRVSHRNLLGPHLPAQKDAAICDVGCGWGYALEWLHGLGYTNLTGIDTDAGQVAFARARGLAIQRVDDSAAFLRARPGAFDLVLFMDVLEHLPRGPDRDVLEAIHGALRPGGRLLCTVPNAFSPLASYWRYIDYTHHTIFTPERLEFLLTHAGFRLGGIQPLEICPAPRFWCWPPTRRVLRWWLIKLSRLPWRLSCIGELGWRGGRNVPLSPNLLVLATRD